MQPALAKKVARRVMALALFISPPASRDWADAMAAELDYVDGSFKALSWSIGCLGTAMKQLCISIFLPGAVAVETEGTMSKFAKISAGALVVGSALFLFAPTFRQGLKLTAASWHQSDSAWLSQMQKLGAEGEAKHDAKALAFAAMQLNDGWESDPRVDAQDRLLRDKFADEAVQWDSYLTWIYYPLLSRDRGSQARDTNDTRWMERLQAWDPNNASVYAREASFYWPHGVTGLEPQADRVLLADSPQWLENMERAFSAAEYDSYAARKTALDIEVAQRYGVDDPTRMLLGSASYPVYERANFELFAKDFLLEAGASFEAKGDLHHAEESYQRVAHLGQLIQLHSANESESMMAAELQLSAGPSLERVFEKSGNASAARLVLYETELAQQTKSRIINTGPFWSDDRDLLDAYITQLSLLAMALSLTLIVCCGIYFLIRRMFHARAVGLRRVFSGVAVFGTALLFASSIAMYLGYAPYAEAFRNYLAAPDPLNARQSLTRFWGLHEFSVSVVNWFGSSASKVDFWYTVIAVGATIIAWILCRYIARTFHHSAPVQPSA